MDTILNRRPYVHNKRAWLIACLMLFSLLIAKSVAYGATSWQTETVTSLGNVLRQAGIQSLAIVNGQPAMSYVHGDTDDVKYARYDGTSWQIETVISDSDGITSLAMVNGQPAIGIGRNSDLLYARYDGTSWQVETVDPEGGTVPSLTVVNGQPAMSYVRRIDDKFARMYAYYDGATWQIEIVDPDANQPSSLAMVNGQPAIAYITASPHQVKYARYDGTAWQIEIVNSDGGGIPVLAVVDGQPAIVFRDSSAEEIKYTRYDGTTWQTETIDSVGTSTVAISRLAIVDGQPAFSYYDRSITELKYARYDGSAWQIATVDSTGEVGASVDLAVIEGQPVVSYADKTDSEAKLKFAQLQTVNEPPLVTALAAASAGDTITLDASENHTTALDVNKSITLDLNGQTMTAGATPLTISASNVIIKNGTLDGSGAAAAALDAPTQNVALEVGGATAQDVAQDVNASTLTGIVLNADVDSVTLENVEITGFGNGVQIDTTIDGFKLVNSYIHDNSGHGVHIASGVSLNGLVTIQGNLFKNNGGNGLNNEGDTANLPAQYNNWGDVAGATGANGDGVSANVDASNPTYAKFYVDVIPATLASTHSVLESDQFTVDVDVDAAGLYALHYQLSYDSDLVTLNSTADGDVHGSGACLTNTETAGVVDVLCYRLNPDADVNAAANVITSLTFTADLSGIGAEEDGAWTNLFDLNHVSAEIGAGARSGINIFVDTDDIADTDDGNIVIRAIGQYAGLVDLEGRVDDSGATITVHNDAARTTQMATATTTADGRFLTAYEATEKMIIGSEYHLTIDAPLALATDITAANLHDRPTTNLSLLTLLGGDATDDESISLADATCIAGDFGTTTSTCVTGSSDVNGDGNIDLIDLSLMGGNFGSSSSSWTP